MLEGWEIRQPVDLHRIRDTRIGYAINQWCFDLSHSMKLYLHFWPHGKMQSFRKYLSRQPRTQGPLSSSLEKVPWFRLVTCLP